jgi:hypothetical protein
MVTQTLRPVYAFTFWLGAPSAGRAVARAAGGPPRLPRDLGAAPPPAKSPGSLLIRARRAPAVDAPPPALPVSPQPLGGCGGAGFQVRSRRSGQHRRAGGAQRRPGPLAGCFDERARVHQRSLPPAEESARGATRPLLQPAPAGQAAAAAAPFAWMADPCGTGIHAQVAHRHRAWMSARPPWAPHDLHPQGPGGGQHAAAVRRRAGEAESRGAPRASDTPCPSAGHKKKPTRRKAAAARQGEERHVHLLLRALRLQDRAATAHLAVGGGPSLQARPPRRSSHIVNCSSRHSSSPRRSQRALHEHAARNAELIERGLGAAGLPQPQVVILYIYRSARPRATVPPG